MKDALTEMKNNLQGINSRVDEAEIKSEICNIRKEKKNTQSAKRKKSIQKKNEDSVRRLWDNYKCTNICIIGVLEGEAREQVIGEWFEKNDDKTSLTWCRK